MKTVIIIAALCFTQQLFGQAESIPAPTLKGGIYNRTTLGILAGEESSNISFMSCNGYRFKNNIELGLGLGLERSYYSWKAPLFLDMRYNFKLKKAVSTFPFVSLIGGYEAGLNNYTRSRGGFGNASIGLTHYFTDHIGITTSLGYRYSYSEEDNQYYCFDLIYYPYPSTTIKELHRFEMRIGLAIR